MQTREIKIKYRGGDKTVVIMSGGFCSHNDYFVIEGKQMRKPTSYEYQKIYKKLKEDSKMRRVKAEAKANFDYKKVLDKETQMFAEAENKRGGKKVKTLEERQSVVTSDLERIYGVKLRETNSKKGGSEPMKKQGGVKTKKTTKTVPPKPKVDIKQQEKKAIIMLNELKGLAKANGRILVFTNPNKAQYCSYNIGGRFCFGVNYSATKFSPYFLVNKAQFEASKIAGKYNGRYCVCSLEKRNISDFKDLTQQAINNFPVKMKKVAKKTKKTKK